MAGIQLLHDFVEIKRKFYPVARARYDLAMPGSFSLLPTQAEPLARLKENYRAMQLMLFGEPPPFDSILQELRDLQGQINALA